jgi:hypothetical protein
MRQPDDASQVRTTETTATGGVSGDPINETEGSDE